MKVAAAADIHARLGDEARIRGLFQGVSERADVLILAGDLTHHGRPDEAEALLRGLDDVSIPTLVILGNHDHQNGSPQDLLRMLTSGGLRCIDRDGILIDGVGFAGTKGFGGGFGERIVQGFGEDATKAFVAESVVEAEALRGSLKRLDAERKVAVTHYAPIRDTVQGEPPEIFPFMGCSRLADAIDEGGAQIAIHGHAHRGSPQGRTPRGVPVRNVSIPVLLERQKEAYIVFDV